MNTYEKEYVLTLKFNRLSMLHCIASLYQLFQIRMRQEVDSVDIEDLPLALNHLLFCVDDLLRYDFITLQDAHNWRRLSVHLLSVNDKIQCQLNALNEDST